MANNTNDQNNGVVVVGAGLAAVSAAEALRDGGYDGPVTLVGNEPEAPYERPQLSKGFLLGKKDFSHAREASWYTDHDVTLRTGVTATGLDRERRIVTLDDGSTLAYDDLLLATGATPRVPDIPGAGGANVLRTVADARRLKALVTEGTHVVLVGGGWIGLEVAAAVTELGGRATVLEAAEQPLLGVLGPTMAAHFADLHARHGVDIRTGTEVTGIAPDAVDTAEERIAADVVVLAVGAAPETSLARAAGLEVEDRAPGGIVVDEHLRTSDPHVYAAGDVALATNLRLAKIRVEHWDNAIRQGQLAAATILGQDAAYDWVPYFFTDQFELGMEYVGRADPDDEVVVRGDREAGEFIAYWLDHGKVTAAMNVGIWDVSDRLRELVGTEVDRDDLTDMR